MKRIINGVEYDVKPRANLRFANLSDADLTGAYLPDGTELADILAKFTNPTGESK